MTKDERLAMLRREWDDMQRRGRTRYVLLHVLAWTGAVTLMNGLLLVIAKLVWVRVPVMSYLDIVIFGVVSGGVVSEFHWSDLKRKFRTPPPSEDWMTR